jgi:hypothetical protein
MMPVMAPSIVMSAAATPSVMVTASTVTPAMAVPATVAAPHEDHSVVLLGNRTDRRHSQPRRCGHGHGEGNRDCGGSDQGCAFHVILLQSRNCDNCHNFPEAK